MTSLWLDRGTPIADDPLPPPDQPLDALVVGAGLTGLTTSLLLARAGLRVACVEARHVGAVTTGRTTGKVSLLQGTHLSRIVRHQPVEVASAYVDANREGMEWLLRFCADHDVAVQRRTAVTYAATDDELKAVEEEHHAATTLGLPVTWRDTLDVSFPHVGSTNLADQAQLDAMDVLAALVAQVRQHGGTVHQGHRVRSVSQWGTPTVRLEGGGTLGAEHVVLATGTPILDRGLHFARLEPQRSYVLALTGAQPLEGMYLSAGSDSRSLRDAPGGRLVVGGSGHVVGRTDSHLAHLEALRSWAARLVPADHGDPPLVGAGLRLPGRAPDRGTAGPERRPRPRRDGIREVGHGQRSRRGPDHLERHRGRAPAMGAGAARPSPRPLGRR